MTLDIRALGFVLFLAAAGVIIYAMSSGSGDKPRVVPMDTSDPARFPWTLQKKVAGGTLGRYVYGHYPSKAICEKFRERMDYPAVWECVRRKS